MKVPGKFPLTILIGLAACTWLAVAALLYGTPPELAFFKPMGIVTAIIASVLAAYDRWIWRIPGFSAMHGVPNLNGTWLGETRSMWTDQRTGETPPPIRTAVVIRQTYTTLSLRVFTGESTSVSVTAGIAFEADGRPLITCLYRNEPSLSNQDRSRVHDGGAKLALAGACDVLEGSYWTNRDTKGEMSLRRVSRKHALDLSSAEKLAPPGA